MRCLSTFFLKGWLAKKTSKDNATQPTRPKAPRFCFRWVVKLTLLTMISCRFSFPWVFTLIHIHYSSLPFLFTLIFLLPSSLFYYSTSLKKNGSLIHSLKLVQEAVRVLLVRRGRCTFVTKVRVGIKVSRLQQEFPIGKGKPFNTQIFSYVLAGFDVFFWGYMFKRPGHSLVNTAGAGDKFVELSVGSADRIIVYSDI